MPNVKIDELEQIRAALDNAQAFCIAYDLMRRFSSLDEGEAFASPLSTHLEEGKDLIDKHLNKRPRKINNE